MDNANSELNTNKNSTNVTYEKSPNTLFGALMKLTGAVLTGMTKISYKLGDAAVKGTVKVADNAISDSVDWVYGEDITGQSFDQVVSKSKHKIRTMYAVSQHIANDPEMKEILKKITEILVELSVELLKDSEKPMKELVDRSAILASEVGQEAAVGAVKVGRDAASAATAAIPVVGPIFDAILLLSDISTAALKSGRITTKHYNEISSIVDKLLGDVLPKMNTSMGQIEAINNESKGVYDRVYKELGDITSGVETTADQMSKIPVEKKGGRRKRKSQKYSRKKRKLSRKP
jgi:hypothetical protein